MTLTQARKLKAGDRVVWPEGANGCARCEGTVREEKSACGDSFYVQWDSSNQGDRTYLYDAAAVKYIERLPSVAAASK